MSTDCTACVIRSVCSYKRNVSGCCFGNWEEESCDGSICRAVLHCFLVKHCGEAVAIIEEKEGDWTGNPGI